ncbi:MAG: ATP-dependent metalloprotease, partial [Gammaproteobacteria bacterium]
GDIDMASNIARAMVTQWGFSEALGPIAFMDNATGQKKPVSDQISHLIDTEVKRFIDEGYATAETLLKDNLDKLHAMTRALIKYETLDAQQIAQIMQGDEPTPPADWGDDDNGADSGAKNTDNEPRGDDVGSASLH